MKIYRIALKDKLKGGRGDNNDVDKLVKKHGVKEAKIRKEIEKGLEVEMEHTDDEKVAMEIVMDHLTEFPDYYTNPKHGLLVQEKQLGG